jgi:hypothetical protein
MRFDGATSRMTPVKDDAIGLQGRHDAVPPSFVRALHPQPPCGLAPRTTIF